VFYIFINEEDVLCVVLQNVLIGVRQRGGILVKYIYIFEMGRMSDGWMDGGLGRGTLFILFKVMLCYHFLPIALQYLPIAITGPSYSNP